MAQLVRRLIFCQKVRGSNPALTTFFRVFESFQGFQPFVVLESYINTSIRNNNSVFRKHTFFVIILPLCPFKIV